MSYGPPMTRLTSALLLLAFVSACRNDAITYAKLIAPTAKCNAIHTGETSREVDTAVCRVGSEIWRCSAGSTPSCSKVMDVTVEKP